MIFYFPKFNLISEGKNLAMSYKGKFIETSAGLKHNVDELLVGILKQILLRYEEIQAPTTLVRVSV